jgi:hypothetical protein
MNERPPVWVSFKVSDIPDLPGTKIGDFVVDSVMKIDGQYRVVLLCPTCDRARETTLYNANRAVGRCKHH